MSAQPIALGTETLEHWATTHPERVAVVDHERAMTYGDLNAAADSLAQWLHVRGVSAGDKVAVRMRVRAEWFVINRAVGKIGAEHVALNYRLTAGETADLVRDAGACVLVTDDPDPDEIDIACGGMGLRAVLHIEGDPPSAAWQAAVQSADVPRRAGPAITPIVIFTSGTTGRPKGVSFHDRLPFDQTLVDRYFTAVADTPPRSPGAQVLLTLPLHHAAGPFEATVTHQGGGCLFLLSRFDAEQALALIERHRVTHWMVVPTMLLRVRAALESGSGPYDTSSIQTLYVGAAPVPQHLKEWVVDRFGGDVLWEQYGSTESSAMTFMTPVDQLRKPGSSGRPFPSVQIRIIDAVGRELGPYTTGEVSVRTPGQVGRYLGQPPMDVSVLSADGFFRTGDVGHLDADGYLYLTDRLKDMIVTGGVNVYPAEIEKVLTQHPAVLDCAVIGVPHDDLGEQPLAFLETRDGFTAPSLDDLALFLGPRLARYKHPRLIEAGVTLPRNPAGKVLKAELRAPYWRDRARGI